MSRDDLDALLEQLSDAASMAWNEETYDLARARSLDADDRATFVARLLQHADEGDTRAILTLGELDATEAIAPLLRLSAAQGPAAATARRALVRLGRGLDVVAEIGRDATLGASRTVRAAAVLDLGRIGGATAIGALDACLEDADAVVRQLAVDSLVAALGLHQYTLDAAGARELRTPLERMKLLIGSDLAALVKLGAAELRAALAQVQAGRTPEQAGLGWSPTMPAQVRSSLTAALVDENEPIATDELAKIAGPDRRWAEALIAIALERQDLRAPSALAKLDAKWTLPALDDACASAADGPFRRELEAARRTLNSALRGHG